MKTVILCIDGLGWYNLEILPLPFLRKLVKSSIYRTPYYKNVLERGWPAIYTGQKVNKTKAYYYAPKLDKKNKLEITNKTGLSSISKNIDIEFIWEEINKIDLKTGIFCLPTCTEPVDINGFFLSATGAGRVNASLSIDDIRPAYLYEKFPEIQGDLGLRMGYGAFIPKNNIELKKFLLSHIHSTFHALNYMLENQNVDVLFFGIRLITEICYKFIALFDKKHSENLNDFQLSIKQIIIDSLIIFENKLEELLKEIKPENILVVSDHGIKNMDYEMNINELFVEAKLINRSKGLKEILKPFYYFIKQNLTGKIMPNLVIPKYDIDNAEAYSVGFTDAIYFKRDVEQAQLIRIIQETIDKLKLNKFLKLEKYFVDHQYNYDNFIDPDYRIVLEEGIMNTGRHTQILKKNTNLLPNKNLWKYGFWGESSGCKSKDAVFSCKSKNKIEIPQNLNLYDIKDIILQTLI